MRFYLLVACILADGRLFVESFFENSGVDPDGSKKSGTNCLPSARVPGQPPPSNDGTPFAREGGFESQGEHIFKKLTMSVFITLSMKYSYLRMLKV